MNKFVSEFSELNLPIFFATKLNYIHISLTNTLWTLLTAMNDNCNI